MSVITTIAEQTNLLALNATIEAARWGARSLAALPPRADMTMNRDDGGKTHETLDAS